MRKLIIKLWINHRVEDRLKKNKKATMLVKVNLIIKLIQRINLQQVKSAKEMLVELLKEMNAN